MDWKIDVSISMSGCRPKKASIYRCPGQGVCINFYTDKPNKKMSKLFKELPIIPLAKHPSDPNTWIHVQAKNELQAIDLLRALGVGIAQI